VYCGNVSLKAMRAAIIANQRRVAGRNYDSGSWNL
jgi:hypothetical protein